MSIMRILEVECPRCGNKENVDLWDSINVQINPEAKEALLEGKLHQFHCSICDHKAGIEKKFLYHDMGKEFCVYFFPFPSTESDDFYDEFTADAQMDMSRTGVEDDSPDYFRNAHVVFSMDELVRYVIFRDNLFRQKVWSSRG